MADKDVDRLFPATDRLQEAHFFLHGLEDFYHFANPFRWHLNTFLRALKEIPQLVSMALQNRPGFPQWYASERAALSTDPLVGFLSKQRDVLVHQGMLKPSSAAFIGITEGRGMKLGLGVRVDPLMDSDDAMRSYLSIVNERGDTLELLRDDEDSLPAVERRWGFGPFGEADIVDLSVTAWHRVADHLTDVFAYIGEPQPKPTLECRHDLDKVRIRAYDRDELRVGIVRGFPFG